MFQALIGFPGPTELIIIMVIILLLFGGAKLPEMARNIGRGMRVFKEEANSLKREIEVADQPGKPVSGTKPSSAGSDASAASDTEIKSDASTPEAKAEKVES